jgi:outer membrane protein assembly factor BamB
VDIATGATAWGPVSLTGPATGCPAILAADNGRVFVQESGVLHALDAGSGTELWSRLVGEGLTCPNPVASAGQLFVGPMRLDEETGAQLWLRNLGFARLDAITATDVYVDTGCENLSDLAAADGRQAWTRSGTTCDSGTPFLAPGLFGGRLYTQDFALSDPSPRAIVDAGTGAQVSTYASRVPPAFAGSLAYFVVGGVLEAHNLSDLSLAWTFAGDTTLVTAPVVANGVVYVGSSSGNLYGVDTALGTQLWAAGVGTALSAPDPVFAPELTGLAVGEGWLLVPAGTRLTAYSSAAPATGSRVSRAARS